MQSITPEQMSEIIGVPPPALELMPAVFPFPSLGYRILRGPKRDRVVRNVLDLVAEGKLRAAGANDPANWRRGWGRIRDIVRDEGVSLETLSPQYHKPLPACRLGGDYVESDDPLFEFKLSVTVRKALLGHFLKDHGKIVEFGCGTGLNLFILAQLFPDKELIGCDWVAPSLEMLGEIAASLDRPIGGCVFNMLDLAGGDDVPLAPDTAVVTALAMEQLGKDFLPFLGFLLDRKPAFCLHIEPLVELYDNDDAADAAAIRYHRYRNYLEGYVPALRALAADGTIEIISERRVKFGNMFHDQYSTLAWRPL
ncbi:MAG: class I SAM-dependent methyltransferase [Proteobacteria bacterium]|nr:class I SAM-dependent methyltransferase [Pseudomonadota bacterium]